MWTSRSRCTAAASSFTTPTNASRRERRRRRPENAADADASVRPASPSPSPSSESSSSSLSRLAFPAGTKMMLNYRNYGKNAAVFGDETDKWKPYDRPANGGKAPEPGDARPAFDAAERAVWRARDSGEEGWQQLPPVAEYERGGLSSIAHAMRRSPEERMQQLQEMAQARRARIRAEREGR